MCIKCECVGEGAGHSSRVRLHAGCHGGCDRNSNSACVGEARGIARVAPSCVSPWCLRRQKGLAARLAWVVSLHSLSFHDSPRALAAFTIGLGFLMFAMKFNHRRGLSPRDLHLFTLGVICFLAVMQCVHDRRCLLTPRGRHVFPRDTGFPFR